MEEINLELLHQDLLIIMDEIDRICLKNKINYSLAGGSLIGAIRHGGFIPWDDDMDVVMMREDYDKFVIACSQDLDNKFFLQNIDTDPEFCYGFSKILLNGTHLIQKNCEKTKFRQEIFVDIFPIDNIPNNRFQQFVQKQKNYFLIKVITKKMGITNDPDWNYKKKIVFCFIKFISLFFSKKHLTDQLVSNMLKYRNQNSDLVCALSGLYGYDKEKIKRDYFSRYERKKFENRNYSVISSYDEYLRHFFGDYLTLPPIEMRKSHSIQEINFGIYQ